MGNSLLFKQRKDNKIGGAGATTQEAWAPKVPEALVTQPAETKCRWQSGGQAAHKTEAETSAG
jgi:hypothetical protein